MSISRRRFLLATSASVACAAAASLRAEGTPRIGVTLHPYFSWASAVVVDTPLQIVPAIPGDVDIDAYTPRPADVAALRGLDAIVVNGIGHDDVVLRMLQSAAFSPTRIIRVNDGTPLVRAAHGDAVNSHTFLSLGNAIQQTFAIARALGARFPTYARAFDNNAAAYAKRLRRMRADTQERLVDAKVTRVVTVHDGYGYLLQEFGIDLVGVVEPAHGLLPSAQELAQMVALVKREQIRVVFAEESFPPALARPLQEAGAALFTLSHVATGPFTPTRFEDEMQRNLQTLVQALA